MQDSDTACRLSEDCSPDSASSSVAFRLRTMSVVVGRGGQRYEEMWVEPAE